MADPSALEETIAILEATLDATHDGVVVFDLNRRLIRYNRRFLEIFRITPDVVAGGVPAIASYIRAQLDESAPFLFDADAMWTDPASESTSLMRCRDGRIVERFVAPQRVEGRIVGRVASYRDVGDSIRAADAIEQHRAFLERAAELDVQEAQQFFLKSLRISQECGQTREMLASLLDLASCAPNGMRLLGSSEDGTVA